jgi:DNA-binding transcriptional LysR family regulator
MEISQLEAFVAVVEERSFSRAAAKLLRTQPAISQSVKRLEDWAKEPLLDRSSKSGVLTEAGTVGANESTALYLLPVLKKFRDRYPRVKVAVKRSLSREIPSALLRYEIELGVLSFNPRNVDLESTVVSLDELNLIVPPGHPLARARQVSIHRLGEERFIAHNVASPYRQRVMETFDRLRTPLNIAIELPTVETIKKSVRMGIGIAFAPRMCIEDELARGELVAVRVKETQIQRKLRLIYRRHSALSTAAQAFVEVAKGLAQKEVPAAALP